MSTLLMPRQTRHFVGVSAIAEMARKSRQRADAMTKNSWFPEPLQAYARRGRLWDGEQVAAALRVNGHRAYPPWESPEEREQRNAGVPESPPGPGRPAK